MRSGSALALALPAVVFAGPRVLVAQDEPPVFGVTSSVVKVDVVVRDRDGRPVRDLRAGDFAVYEDGTRQRIEAFRVVSRDGLPALPAPAPPEPASGDGVREQARPPEEAEPAGAPAPSVIAFVFDRMSASARAQAHRAAMSYATRGHVDGDVVGVFSIDQALHTLQGFTPNLDLVEAAFDSVQGASDTPFADTREHARDRTAEQQKAETLLRELAAGGSRDPAQMMAAAVRAANARLEANIARSFDALERDQQGFATTDGLMAIVKGLGTLPGRKTVIFLSEGVALPASVLAQFRSVIATANRAQVSLYCIDAGGLRVQSGAHETREELVQAGERRLFQQAGGNLYASEDPLTRGMERNEDFLRLDPDAGLGQLAEETGGFLVRDTNDAGAGFRRIAEDMRFHYLLSYTPSNATYDGRFRQIRVTVDRPGVEVQSRKGYFAVAPDVSVPLRSYEAPALAQLERPARPGDFPFHATALSFPEGQRPGRVSVLASVPGSAIGYDPPGKLSSDNEADFAIVVRIRDADGREVDRVSQRYLLSVPPGNLDAARRGDVLFFKESDLPPGRYSIEAVAYDATCGAASVRTTSVEVPPLGAERQLRLSSVTLVDRAEELSATQRPRGNPLLYGDLMLYPNLGEPLRKSASKRLGFYFTAYDADRYTAPVATIDVLRGGSALASVSHRLPVPGADGRVQYAGTLPLDALPDGALTLRVRVDDGSATVTGVAPFTVTE